MAYLLTTGATLGPIARVGNPAGRATIGRGGSTREDAGARTASPSTIRRARRRLVCLLAGVLCAGLLACATPAQVAPAGVSATSARAEVGGVPASAGSPPTATLAAPRALKPVSMVIPNLALNYLPHRIAQAQGFYREAGLDVDVQIMQSNAGLAAIVSGEVAFGDYTGSAIRAAARGLPVRLVECHGVRPIYHLALAPGLQSLADVDGKAVGIGAIGADTDVFARDLVRKYGGDPSKLEFDALGASNVRFAALMSGRVGAAILLITETVQARDADLTVLGTADDMPLGCDSGVVVTVDAYTQRPQEVRDIIGAVRKAVQFMQQDRTESVRLLAEWQQVEPRQAAQAYDLASVQTSYSLDKAAGQRAIENALAFSKQAGEVDPGVQLSDVADLALVP